MRALKPAAAMGAGGYVAGPLGLAAVLGRVPLVLTEADSHLGLANRLLAPFGDPLDVAGWEDFAASEGCAVVIDAAAAFEIGEK